jgi:metallo-beta-lactamase class B
MPSSSQAGRPTPAAPHRRILINSSFERTVLIIDATIEKLGHQITDVKIILSSHAHGDHVAGRGNH